MPPIRILAVLCGLCLPWVALADTPVLRIQGSNTMGSTLVPALVQGLLQEKGLRAIETQALAPNEQRVSALDAQGRRVYIDIAAHGSSTGFTALGTASADLASSSRPINPRERESLENLGNMTSTDAEHVIAIDGVAVIVHPSNPLRQLSTEQLARLFSGEISDWATLGGKGAVHLYARDDQSGTWETFRELVLKPRNASLSPRAQRLESSEALSQQVSQDPQAIGFIGLPYVRQARALAIADGEGQPMLPSAALVATEDYPLSRRLYFYLPPTRIAPWAQALVDFSQSDQGQAVVAQQGFVAQTVQAMAVPVDPSMPPSYQQLAGQAKRLSVNFRFAEGSASLDNKALADLQRVLAYVQRYDKGHKRLTLVGFGDAKRDPERATLLSKLRAMAVRRELFRAGVVLRDIQALGSQLPVASNEVDGGRLKNQRVEVWVY